MTKNRSGLRGGKAEWSASRMTHEKVANAQAQQKTLEYDSSLTESEYIALKLKAAAKRERRPVTKPSAPKKFSWEE